MEELKILAADADLMTLKFLANFLSLEGFNVFPVTNGVEVVALTNKLQPDLITLEANLTGMDGFQTCTKIRQLSAVPIMFVSARNSVQDRIVGLACGSDDYLGKPFDSAELILRIKALLKRTGKLPDGGLTGGSNCDSININRSNRTVKKYNREISLTAKEFDLLWLLINHPNMVFTREQLAYQIWDTDFYENAAINMLIKRLREKVEDDPTQPKCIKTVRGVGYKFEIGHD